MIFGDRINQRHRLSSNAIALVTTEDRIFSSAIASNSMLCLKQAIAPLSQFQNRRFEWGRSLYLISGGRAIVLSGFYDVCYAVLTHATELCFVIVIINLLPIELLFHIH
jgi:hypothetical protein